MEANITCEGIRIGGVPGDEVLKELARQGVKTLIDVREQNEGETGEIEAKARALGLNYLSIPISKRRVEIGQIDKFKEAVGNASNAPVYAFSRGGKRPVGVLCFLACAGLGESVLEVFHKAKTYGRAIDKEFALKKFILDFYSSRRGDMLNNHFKHQSV